MSIEVKNYQGPSRFKIIALTVLGIIFMLFCIFVFRIGTVINVVGVNANESENHRSFWEKMVAILPLSDFKKNLQEINDYKKDPQRLDILILGIRGEDDPNAGLLADMIMVLSYKKNTGQLALISIPRDLYVSISGIDKKERLNYAYSYGEFKEAGGGGLRLSKRVVSNIIGLNIDYAVSIDFRAFQEIVDILGGVTIYRDKPFIEDLQWQGEGMDKSPFWYKKAIIDANTGREKEIWALHIPEGKSILDGNAALYYVRSRYTTSDFDRCRRQQEVLLALKDKAFSLGVLANPLKISKIAESLKKHLRIDVPMDKVFDFIELAHDSKLNDIKKIVFDTTPAGLLYETHSYDGSYILLPVGNNFDKIREACRNIFN